MRAEWLDLAILARYGHQDISSLLGRRLTRFERSLLSLAIQHWIEHDYAKPSDQAALGLPDPSDP